MNNYFLVFMLYAVLMNSVAIALLVKLLQKNKTIEMLKGCVDAKNGYILRLYTEYKKAKGIDKPFMIPLDPAPYFDIAAVFKAAEEAATEEPAAEEAAEEEAEEEAEEGGAA